MLKNSLQIDEYCEENDLEKLMFKK